MRVTTERLALIRMREGKNWRIPSVRSSGQSHLQAEETFFRGRMFVFYFLPFASWDEFLNANDPLIKISAGKKGNFFVGKG